LFKLLFASNNCAITILDTTQHHEKKSIANIQNKIY